MNKVYVFGSLNMDLVIESPREVGQGETVHGSGFMTNPGGKGANQAVACGKLGAKTLMGGCIGTDDFGTRLLESLTASGVDVSRVRRAEEASTGVAMILIVNGDNRIILDAGANAAACEADVDVLLRDAEPGDLLLVQLENRLEVIGYALKTAKAKGMRTVLNPAPFDPNVKAYLPFVDIITPNETEFAGLLPELLPEGCDLTALDLEEGAKALCDNGVKSVIVTLGGRGYAYFTTETGLRFGSALPCKVVDTTAAGDTFCGGLATMLACGKDLNEALAFANAAAAITVTRPGAQQAIPWRDEVSC